MMNSHKRYSHYKKEEAKDLEDAGTGALNANLEPNKRIENIEKELHILKGSIKKLMIDIREEMNNYENPFLNLQQFQAAIPAEEVKNIGEIDENSPENIEDQPDEEPLSAPETKKPESETQSNEKGAIQSSKLQKMELEKIIKMMQWTRAVLAKNGRERFNNLLDVYIAMGYLSVDTKNIIEKMSKLFPASAEPMNKDLDIKDCVADMYSLFMILNPRDKELDSKVLRVMLGNEGNA